MTRAKRLKYSVADFSKLLLQPEQLAYSLPGATKMPAGAQQLAYSIPDLIKLSAVGRSSIYEEIGAGRLKARKRGRRTIILREDAEQWLASLPTFGAQKPTNSD
jgi:hypothetical protein